MGLTALMAQVVLTRELLGLFYGNELSIALVLAVWLVAVAAGSAVGARFGQRLHTPERAFGWSQAAMAGLLPVSLALARRVQPGSPAPGQVLGPGAMLLASLETLAPVCLLAGVQFVLAARAAADQRRTSAASAVSGVAAVYALEAAGAVIGGVVFPVWFAQHAGPFFTLSALGLLNLASAALLLRSSLTRRTPLAGAGLPARRRAAGAWSDSRPGRDGDPACEPPLGESEPGCRCLLPLRRTRRRSASRTGGLFPERCAAVHLAG